MTFLRLQQEQFAAGTCDENDPLCKFERAVGAQTVPSDQPILTRLQAAREGRGNLADLLRVFNQEEEIRRGAAEQDGRDVTVPSIRSRPGGVRGVIEDVKQEVGGVLRNLEETGVGLLTRPLAAIGAEEAFLGEGGPLKAARPLIFTERKMANLRKLFPGKSERQLRNIKDARDAAAALSRAQAKARGLKANTLRDADPEALDLFNRALDRAFGGGQQRIFTEYGRLMRAGASPDELIKIDALIQRANPTTADAQKILRRFRNSKSEDAATLFIIELEDAARADLPENWAQEVLETVSKTPNQ